MSATSVELLRWGGGRRRPKTGETVYLAVDRALPIAGEKMDGLVGIVGEEHLGVIVKIGRGTVTVQRCAPAPRRSCWSWLREPAI